MTETTKWYIVWLSGFDRTIKWYKKASEILVVISSFTQTIKYYKKIISVSGFTQTIKYYKKQDQRPFSPMMLVKCSAMLGNARQCSAMLDNAGMIDRSIKWNILTNYKAYIMCICSLEHLIRDHATLSILKMYDRIYNRNCQNFQSCFLGFLVVL